MQEDAFGAAVDDSVYVVGFEHRFAVDDDVVTLDGYHFAGVLVNEVFHPGAQYPCGQLAAYGLFKVRTVYFHLVRQVEYLQYLLVVLVADGTQQRRDGELLLAVDVGVHHVVDVRGELYPRPLERNDTCGVEFGAVGVYALPEEYARRTVELRYDDPLGTVDDECAARRHVGDGTEIDILYHRVEVLVFRVRTVEFQFRLERDAVGQAAFEALLYGIAGRVDIVIDEFQNEVVPCIGYREIFHEHFVEPLVLAVLCGGVELEKVVE